MTNSGSLESGFRKQAFPNGYEFVNGVAMHAENGDRFRIPPKVIKKYIRAGQFVELRLDSNRFSMQDDAPDKCYCESCECESNKPILRHEHPASLVSIPPQNVPSHGWGEDFWVRISERDGPYFVGVVDNPLYEARLHGVKQGDEVFFHADHMLAIHDVHRQEIVLSMEPDDLKKLAEWLGSQQQ